MDPEESKESRFVQAKVIMWRRGHVCLRKGICLLCVVFLRRYFPSSLFSWRAAVSADTQYPGLEAYLQLVRSERNAHTAYFLCTSADA